MKKYIQEPQKVVRLTISQKDIITQHYTFTECTREECMQTVIKLIDRLKLSVFADMPKTRIDFRNAIGAKNLDSKSISFKGLTAFQVYDLLEKHYGL